MYISSDLVEVICRITDIPFPNDFMIHSLGRLRFAQHRPRAETFGKHLVRGAAASAA